jgi:hypothetical protein
VAPHDSYIAAAVKEIPPPLMTSVPVVPQNPVFAMLPLSISTVALPQSPIHAELRPLRVPPYVWLAAVTSEKALPPQVTTMPVE